MYDCSRLEIPMEMTEIIPGKLYLGGVYDAADIKQIEKFNVNYAKYQNQFSILNIYVNE